MRANPYTIRLDPELKLRCRQLLAAEMGRGDREEATLSGLISELLREWADLMERGQKGAK